MKIHVYRPKGPSRFGIHKNGNLISGSLKWVLFWVVW